MTRLRSTPERNDAVCKYGENIAARELTREGMFLIDRNWRCDQGEVDLVMRDDHTLVIVEVKTRTTGVGGSPLEAVDRRKAERLRRLAALWAAQHSVRARDIRIDLVGVLVPEKGAPFVDHVRGVG